MKVGLAVKGGATEFDRLSEYSASKIRSPEEASPRQVKAQENEATAIERFARIQVFAVAEVLPKGRFESFLSLFGCRQVKQARSLSRHGLMKTWRSLTTGLICENVAALLGLRLRHLSGSLLDVRVECAVNPAAVLDVRMPSVPNAAKSAAGGLCGV